MQLLKKLIASNMLYTQQVCRYSLCASDLDDLWNKDFNKKNLNEYTSLESRNYAKNYRPTKVILKKFHDSNKSNYYMKSSEKKSKKGN